MNFSARALVLVTAMGLTWAKDGALSLRRNELRLPDELEIFEGMKFDITKAIKDTCTADECKIRGSISLAGMVPEVSFGDVLLSVSPTAPYDVKEFKASNAVMGDFDIKGAGMTIGFQKGKDLEALNGYLDGEKKYLYLKYQSAFTFGGFSVSPPNGVEVFIAFRPTHPIGFFMDYEGPFIKIAPIFEISHVALGFMEENGVNFVPDCSWGADYCEMSPFIKKVKGDALMAGTLSAGLNDVVSIDTEAEAVYNFKENVGVQDAWPMQSFGVQGKVKAGISVGSISTPFECEFGGGLAIYERSNKIASKNILGIKHEIDYGQTFVVSGNASGGLKQCKFGPFDKFTKFFTFSQDKMKFYAHYTSKKGSMFVPQVKVLVEAESKIEWKGVSYQLGLATIAVNDNGVSFKAKFNFGVSKVKIEGQISDTGFSFNGENAAKAEFGDKTYGKIKFEGKVSTTVFYERSAMMVTFKGSAYAKGCIAGNCDRKNVGDIKIEVSGSGEIKLCGKVPFGIGKKCVKIDSD